MNLPDIPPVLLLGEPADDSGNARCAHHLIGERVAYTAALGWLAWNGHYWQEDQAESLVDQAILAALRRRRMVAQAAEREAVVKVTQGSYGRVRACKALLRSLVTLPIEAFDGSPDELNVANGVLDLRTGTLHPHSPAQRFTYCLSTPYDAQADASPWLEFLAGALGQGAAADDFDTELLDYVQEAVGYSLTGHTREECLWYIHGPTRSSKGVFTETLLELLGTPLGVEMDFASMTARREGDTQNFDLAPLKPARLVITCESNAHDTLNTGKIKALTGGNFIRCSFKHRTHFTYRPQFKAWLVSNHPVSADVDDDAVWRRVKVLHFPHSHAGREDKALKRRLRTPEVLRGVLRWAVAGAAAWYASPKGLLHPRRVEAATREQRAELDVVQMWLEECCAEEDVWTPHALLYGSFGEWCKANGVAVSSGKVFSQSLARRGFTPDRKLIGGRQVRAIRGLRLALGRDD